MDVKWKCGRICCLKAIKHRMHLHSLLICTIIVCFTKLPTPCRRSLRFLRPKIRTLEKMSTRFPLQSPLFLLGLFLLLWVDGRSICCSRACLFCRIKPLAIAAAMSQKQGCWTPYTQSTDNNNKPPDLSQLLSHFCDCLFALPFDKNEWRSKISTHHERWYKTPNWHDEYKGEVLLNCSYFTWSPVFKQINCFAKYHGLQVTFFLTMIFTWVALFFQIYNTDIYSAVHSRSRGFQTRHFIDILINKVKFSARWTATSTAGVWSDKRVFRFWAVKRRNATTFFSQVEPCDYTYSYVSHIRQVYHISTPVWLKRSVILKTVRGMN